jgi:hypothetical protein
MGTAILVASVSLNELVVLFGTTVKGIIAILIGL